MANFSSKSSKDTGSEGGSARDENGSETKEPTPEYVVLDCSFVAGLDGNAVGGLLKLQVTYSAYQIRQLMCVLEKTPKS